MIGLAVKEATSPLFVKACDEFLYLRPKPEARAARAAGPLREGSRAGEKRRSAMIPDIAREVLEGLLARATGPLNPSLIKETIVRKEPDFDERDHGFSTFNRCWRRWKKTACSGASRGRRGSGTCCRWRHVAQGEARADGFSGSIPGSPVDPPGSNGRASRARLGLKASVGEWLSLVEHLVRDQGVAGSNPVSPTMINSLKEKGLLREPFPIATPMQ